MRKALFNQLLESVQQADRTARRVKVERRCPRCRTHAYHWGNEFGIKNQIACARCGHRWLGRIRRDELT